MNTTRQNDEHSGAKFTYESALPISNGKLGMLLFISTEVMLFTALLASYIVLRFSGTTPWPTGEQVHLNPVLGMVNTGILMISGMTIWFAVRRCAADRSSASKFWLMVTLLLGVAFLGVQVFRIQNQVRTRDFSQHKSGLDSQPSR